MPCESFISDHYGNGRATLMTGRNAYDIIFSRLPLYTFDFDNYGGNCATHKRRRL